MISFTRDELIPSIPHIKYVADIQIQADMRQEYCTIVRGDRNGSTTTVVNPSVYMGPIDRELIQTLFKKLDETTSPQLYKPAASKDEKVALENDEIETIVASYRKLRQVTYLESLVS